MAPGNLAFFSGIGVTEILLILLVALIVFGSRLPEVAKSIGRGYMEFRRGLKSLEQEMEMTEADVDVTGPGRSSVRPESPPGPVGGAPGGAGPEPAVGNGGRVTPETDGASGMEEAR